MPVTIKQGLMKYKNEQGEYVGINTVGETTTAELLDSINAAGATQLSNVNQAGTTQTQAVNSAGATQTNAVNTAGTTQTQAVNSAGSAQVQAINTAGANQLSAINTKGQEVLDSIPSEYSELDGEVRDLNRAFNEKAPVIISSTSGAIASFSDGADDMPIKSLKVEIELVQEGSGDPSPDNVRPISGWTGAKVQKTGKNLVSKADGKTSGTNWWIGSSNANAEPDGTFVLGAGTYTFSFSDAQTGIYVRKNGLSVKIVYNNTQLTFSLAERTPIKLMLYKSNVSVDYWNTLDIQLELGSTATSYEPYQGQTYDIEFPSEAGTVYGGMLDAVNGELVVDRYEHTFDGNETSLVLDSAINVVRFTGRPAIDLAINVVKPLYSHGIYDRNSTINMADNSFGVRTTGYCYIKRTACTTLQDFKDWFAEQYATGSPVQISYLLAETQTYHLTPQEVRTILGQNNIWADTGDTEAEYPTDTKTYVDSKEPEIPVKDVQINGTSILQDGVANVPIASTSSPGVIKIGTAASTGLKINGSNVLLIDCAGATQIKQHANYTMPITPYYQDQSVFYGLAQAAGDTTQSESSNAVGNYTESAKSAISEMLSGSVSISGTTPTINALPGVRYVCGEVSTLDIVTPETGIVDVVFTSGATPTVLTVTPPSGMTMMWANGFDPTALNANTTYEINILDGCLGVAGSWI